MKPLCGSVLLSGIFKVYGARACDTPSSGLDMPLHEVTSCRMLECKLLFLYYLHQGFDQKVPLPAHSGPVLHLFHLIP